MFGLNKRKQKKLDSRIRYQRSDFTKKLDRARHYKRTTGPRAGAEDGQYDFWSKLGLRTRLSRILALLAAIGLVYLIFIPNFLSPQAIMVQGASGDQASIVRADIDSYISRSPFYDPQHNLVFLSAAKLRSALLADPIVYKVTSIKRNFLQRSLTVAVELKSQHYVANHGNVLYSIYNDGTVQGQLNADTGQWLALYPGTVKIKDSGPAGELPTGGKYLSDSVLAQIGQLQDRFKVVTGREIDYFEIPPVVSDTMPPADAGGEGAAVGDTTLPLSVTPPVPPTLPLQPVELYVYAKKQIPNYRGPAPDFKVILDATQSDFNDVLDNLALLLAQTAPDRYNKLVYIDMRFANRGFICLVNTPCAASSAPIAPLPIAPPTNTKGP
jgi:hypothetical protein